MEAALDLRVLRASWGGVVPVDAEELASLGRSGERSKGQPRAKALRFHSLRRAKLIKARGRW